MEAYFKYDPGSFIVWFQSAENPSSRKSAVLSAPSTSNNVYAVTLTITDMPQSMFPGKWVVDWYLVRDNYGTYVQEDFTEQQQQEMWFVFNG